MKIIKPRQLSLISRPFRQHGREWLGIGAVAFLDMAPAPRLQPEAALWAMVADELKGVALDAGLPKAYPEFLLAGRAWGRYCDTEGRCLVGVRLADRSKVLRVSGARHWHGGSASAAVPFESLPLDWAHTYGGPQWAENPQGVGAGKIREQAGPAPLPQIEYPELPLRSPHQLGVPAGFLPLPVSHPLRQQRFGTPDRAWLEHHYPGYPQDMDRGGFNIAPLDQQWPDRADALVGASYELSQLHPDQPLLRGELPRLRALALIGRRGQVDAELLELRLTTVWLFPSAQRMALIYHGQTGIDCFDTADVEHLLLAIEQAQQPRPEGWYQSICQQRLKPGQVTAHGPDDEDLVPMALLPAETEAPARPLRRGELRQRYQQAAAQAEADKAAETLARHLPPASGDTWAPTAPELSRGAVTDAPSSRDLQQHAAAELARAEVQRQQAEQARDQALAHTRARGMDTTAIEASLARSPHGPPRLNPRIERLLVAAPDSFPHETVREPLAQANRRLHEAYRQSAHHQAAAPRKSASASMAQREALERAYREGRSLAGWDLTGLDLGGIDLQGADLGGALMESTDLSGARLDGCDLRRSVLVGSLLQRASLRSARLDDANLAGSQFEDCDLGGTRWHGSVLDDASLLRCRMTGSDLKQCRLGKARLEDIDLRQASLAEMVLDGLEWRNVNLQGSRLRKLAFVQCQLHEVDFCDTDVHGLAMLGCRLDHLTRFARSRLFKTCFVGGCSFDRPDFSSAQLRETNWRGAQLAGLSLAHARIQSSDFTDAVLSGGNLSGAHFEQVQLVRTDLSDANLESADLIGAYLRGACLEGASLQQANLFRANLGEVHMDQHTRFDRAYLERYCAYPLGRSPQEAS